MYYLRTSVTPLTRNIPIVASYGFFILPRLEDGQLPRLFNLIRIINEEQPEPPQPTTFFKLIPVHFENFFFQVHRVFLILKFHFATIVYTLN